MATSQWAITNGNLIRFVDKRRIKWLSLNITEAFGWQEWLQSKLNEYTAQSIQFWFVQRKLQTNRSLCWFWRLPILQTKWNELNWIDLNLTVNVENIFNIYIEIITNWWDEIKKPKYYWVVLLRIIKINWLQVIHQRADQIHFCSVL